MRDGRVSEAIVDGETMGVVVEGLFKSLGDMKVWSTILVTPYAFVN